MIDGKEMKGGKGPLIYIITRQWMKRSDLVDVTFKFLGIDVYFPSFGYVWYCGNGVHER
jgi:hypothetical protein